jgi:rhodanese-related sulfurtransferase
MKNIHVIILGFLVVFLAVLFGAATLRSTQKYRFKVSATDMLVRVTRENHLVTAAELASQAGKDVMIIDVRDPKSFLTNHFRNSINIPFERLLDDENIGIVEDGKTKILICSDGRLSNSAWMILNQFGIANLKVLDGGLNSMNAFLDTRNKLIDLQPGDESVKYDLNKMNGTDSASVSAVAGVNNAKSTKKR